jgi:hypothetical protein
MTRVAIEPSQGQRWIEDDIFEPDDEKGGRCEGWCTGEQVPWVVRCGWDSNACSECAQCPEWRFTMHC